MCWFNVKLEFLRVDFDAAVNGLSDTDLNDLYHDLCRLRGRFELYEGDDTSCYISGWARKDLGYDELRDLLERHGLKDYSEIAILAEKTADLI